MNAAITTMFCFLLTFTLTWGADINADEWTRFRGPNGSGISNDNATPPIEWNDSNNIKWKIKLPGPGHSSPIVIDTKVFLTCWTGYGVETGLKQRDLRLHLLCFDRENGKQLWDRAIEPTLPEEPYRSMFKEHGYASHTPVTDGKRVWAYFGKSGAVCFDMQGNQIWRKNLGKKLDPDHWGSSSSPIVYGDILIVTASVESNTVYGLNKLTGEEVWRYQSDELTSTWSTPILAKVDGNRTDLVLPVPYKLWGLDPKTGEFLWRCDSLDVNAACSSAVINDGIIYFVERGRRGGGSVAIRAGGKGDVTKSHVVWKSRQRGHIGTPIVYDGKLFWVSSGIVNCVSKSDGKGIYKARLNRPQVRGRDTGRPAFPETGTPGGHHSSPVVADGTMYYVSRGGDVYVIKLGDQYEQLVINSFTDGGDFSASPAISDGELFIRSTKMLYCIANQ